MSAQDLPRTRTARDAELDWVQVPCDLPTALHRRGGGNRIPGLHQAGGERIPWQTADDGVDEPPDGNRNIAAERDGLVFDHNAAVTFFEAGDAVQAPQKAIPLIRGQDVFVRAAEIFDLLS